MRDISLTTGGFPLSNERILAMQTAWQEIRHILPALGDKVIISGCEEEDDSYLSQGWIIIDGKLYEVVGDGVAAEEGDLSIGKITETTKVTYENGEQQTFVTRTYYRQGEKTDNHSLDEFTRLSSIKKIQADYVSRYVYNTEVKKLEDAIAALSPSIITTVSTNFVPKGTVIMFGKFINWGAMTTLDGIKTTSGIPYGYVPAGKIKFTTTLSATIIAAWASYLSELGVTGSVTYSNGVFDFTSIAGIDLTDRFVIYGGNGKNFKSSGGEETHTLSVSEMPYHAHSSTLYTKWDTHENGKYSTFNHPTSISSSNSTGATSVNMTSTYQGQTKAHNNMPPYYALYMLIKVI